MLPTGGPLRTPASTLGVGDGAAVRACRELLDVRLPGDTTGWRQTLRTEPDHSFVVNTWTDTPPGAARPEGVPDYVCSVVPDSSPAAVRVQSVRPDVGSPGQVGPDGLAGGQVAPSRVLQFVNAGTVTRGVDDRSALLTVGVGPTFQEAALVFPLLPVLSVCVDRVSLVLDTRTTSGAPDSGQLAAYPALAYRSLAEGHAAPTAAESDGLWDVRPRGAGAVGISVGEYRVDISDLYRAWVDDRFTRTDRFLPAGAPFAVVLRPPLETGPTWAAQLTARGAGQPHLEWVGRAGCR